MQAGMMGPFSPTAVGINRQIMSEETRSRMNKIKKRPYQPQMSIRQVNDAIQSKAKATAIGIKNKRIRSTLPLSEQLIALRNEPGKLSGFYKAKNILVVTEDEVKAGMGGFQVLIDPMKIKEISSEIDKQRKLRKRQEGREKARLDPLTGA